MFTDIINKETFEFTCKTESIARQVRHDIESHTMAQLNHLMETVFSEAILDDMPLKIDKIEVDLGDINAAEMGSGEVLSKFRHIFTQKINDAKNIKRLGIADSVNREEYFNISNQNKPESFQSLIEKKDAPRWIGRNTKRLGVTKGVNAEECFDDLTQNQNELELIQSLIEKGDVPWWVDKNNKLNIDSIVLGLVNNNSETFRGILEEHKATPELLSRLLAQIKPGTFSKIKEWLPGLSDTLLKERYIDEKIGLELSTLSVEHIKNLKKFFAAHTYDSYENNKFKLVDSLIRLFRSAQKNQISFEGSTLELLLRLFGMDPLISTTKNYPASKQPIKKNKIAASVNKLTVFEAELLLFEVSRYLEKENPYYSTKTLSVIENFRSSEQDNYIDENIFYKEKFAKLPSVSNNAEIPGENVSHTTSSDKTSGSSDLKTASSIEKNNANIPGNNLDKNNGDNEQNTESLKKIHEANGEISFSDEKEAVGYNYQFIKMIGFIMKRLKTSNPFLFQYLQKLDKNQLEHLSGIFKKRIHEKRDYKQTISSILEHPFLFQYNLLDILNYLPVSNEEHASSSAYPLKKNNLKKDKPQEIISSMESPSQSRFFSSLTKLPGKGFFIVKDILQKGRFDTESEKNIVKKILHSLSHENIVLLKFLTELPIEQIEQVLPLAANKKEADRFSGNKPEDKKEKKVYIENAGLCLLAVYLPHFFNQLKYLENGKFKNIQIAARAIYILQYLVTGKTKEPEYLLQLNKLICAFQIEDPVVANIHLTKKEKLEADNLIAAVILNWKSLKNTSATGLRESFLQRKGILSEGETSWTLRVEKKGYDLLLDAIPWSYSMIKLPWMKKMIQVEW